MFRSPPLRTSHAHVRVGDGQDLSGEFGVGLRTMGNHEALAAPKSRFVLLHAFLGDAQADQRDPDRVHTIFQHRFFQHLDDPTDERPRNDQRPGIRYQNGSTTEQRPLDSAPELFATSPVSHAVPGSVVADYVLSQEMVASDN